MAKKQGELKGFEREIDEELEDLISRYVDALYRRMELQDQEAELKEEVLAAMSAKRKKRYTYVDGETKYQLELADAQRLKCKREAPPKAVALETETGAAA